jgi:hypothetical protein
MINHQSKTIVARESQIVNRSRICVLLFKENVRSRATVMPRQLPTGRF